MENIEEFNLCYWFGDTGLLDPKNPCKYHGYTSRDIKGRECLRWKTVVEERAAEIDPKSLGGEMLAYISSSNFAQAYPVIKYTLVTQALILGQPFKFYDYHKSYIPDVTNKFN